MGIIPYELRISLNGLHRFLQRFPYCLPAASPKHPSCTSSCLFNMSYTLCFFAALWQSIFALQYQIIAMKQKTTNKLLFALQMMVLAGIAGVAAFGLLSFKAPIHYTDFWLQLGTDKQSGTYSIRESFLGGYLQYGGTRSAKNLLTGDRVAVTKDLLAYTKEYVQSDAFVKEYNNTRAYNKPKPPAPAKTADQIRKENIDSNKEGIANLEKTMKTADADMKKMLQGSLDMLKQSLKDYEDPNSELVKMSVHGEQTQYEWRVNNYQEDLKKWELKYPAEAKIMVKKRLQQLLDITKDVDFNAQLTERNGRKYFVNSVYEKKSSNWKLAYRAGKDVTGAVRAFALQWLAELQ